jgi:acid phosphatase (class A)
MKPIVGVCAALLLCATVQGQQQESLKPQVGAMRAPRTAYYIDPTILDMADLLPAPPSPGSPANNAELDQLHRIEQTRTAAQVAEAQADEAEEDMFVFRTVLGPAFTPEALPLTAALGAHVKNEQSVVGNQLKRLYQRPRPFQIDATMHPVCKLKAEHDSYPSGHALTGYLEALTLVEMVPEKRAEILARAGEYAYNREVCGVHYPSDVQASRMAAYAVFGYMLATPRFQRDLGAAREELRAKLGLSGK